jgi:hypothetical protein
MFVSSPKVGGTGRNLTAANHVLITKKFWILNELCQAFPWVVRLGQKSVPHKWPMNTGPSGYNDRASDPQQLSGVAQIRVLHGLVSRPNITTSMIYHILDSQEDHTKQLTAYGNVLPSDDGEDE